MAWEGMMRGETLQSIRNYLNEALCPSSTEYNCTQKLRYNNEFDFIDL